MEQFLIKGEISDLKCINNHEDSSVFSLLLGCWCNSSNQFLCLKCMENIGHPFEFITINAAIKQIQINEEELSKMEEELLSSTIQKLDEISSQIVQVKNEFEKIFSLLLEELQEWRTKAQELNPKPKEVNLEEELKTLFQKIKHQQMAGLKTDLFNLQSYYSEAIKINFKKFSEILETKNISKLFDDANDSKQPEVDPFPQDQELIAEKQELNVKSMALNFDNTLLFVGCQQFLYSYDLTKDLNKVQLGCINHNNSSFSNIVSSKNKNFFAASYGNCFGLWQHENQVWKSFDILKIHSTKITFLGFNSQENQLIVSSNDEKTSIVQIDFEAKKFRYLQQIMQINNLNILQLNQSRNQLLAYENKQIKCSGLLFGNQVTPSNQETTLLIYYQDIKNYWRYSKKIDLKTDAQLKDALFLHNNDIFIMYADSQTALYHQGAIMELEKYNTFVVDNFSLKFKPKVFNYTRQLYLQNSQNEFYIISRKENQELISWPYVIFSAGKQPIFQWSENGEILAVWDYETQLIRIHKLFYDCQKDD